ncbi:MAG: hypothetical protein JNJ77_16635 [Planctomycetia bacterium]|nr:hypothetical protein [Planctomycetia bacterium]
MKYLITWLKLHFILSIASQLGMWLSIVLVYCLITWLVLDLTGFHINELGTEASLINTIILSLLMGFRNRTAYDRWWEGRRLWGQLVNDSRNLAAKWFAYLPPDELKNTRAVELLTAFPFSLKKHLRKDTYRLQDFPGLEGETAMPAHIPAYIAKHLHQQAALWLREGKINEFMFRNMDLHLNGLLDVCGACERIDNTPIPFSYKAMLRTGLFLHLLIAPWYTISYLGWKGIPVLLLVCFFLMGIEMIDSHIEDPFGHDEDDLDLERYAHTIRDNVIQICSSYRTPNN